MQPLLKITQKYAILVILVIIFSAWFAISDDFPTEVDEGFGNIVGILASVIFVSVPDGLAALWAFFKAVPLVIVLLAGGAVYFTLQLDFINLRGFKHAIDVVRGRYDNDDDPGEVSHFQALSSALSATVGLGNIAGVAVAVTLGGPGAIFWMMLSAVFGMSSKFAECTLGQMYRQVDEKGTVSGGPMVYLRDGLEDMGYPNLGKYLSVAFAILCIAGSFGGGNMFQANQSFEAVSTYVPFFGGEKADGTVRLQTSQPRALNYRAHMVKIERPGVSKKAAREAREQGDESAEPLATLTYEPINPLQITEDSWKRDSNSGQYVIDLKVRSNKTGEQYNVPAGALDTLKLGQVKDRKVDYIAPEGVTIRNLGPTEGGVNGKGLLFGLIMAFLVGLVIIGGVKRIGKVAEKIVPFMCGIYLIAGAIVIVSNITMLPEAFATIVREAFSPMAGLGGAIGVFIQGVRRAAFSSEAGVGSAAIAHSAAKTDEPVREGIVALLEPFIDTVVVCMMTGLVIVITGSHLESSPNFGLEGVSLTAAAFGTTLEWFPAVLTVAVILFAYSTMISWSYYGERCWTFLFGADQSMAYRVIFLLFVVLGCVSSLKNVIDFSDLMILAMAFPNVIGVVILTPKIKDALQRYWAKYQAGDFEIHE